MVVVPEEAEAGIPILRRRPLTKKANRMKIVFRTKIEKPLSHKCHGCNKDGQFVRSQINGRAAQNVFARRLANDPNYTNIVLPVLYYRGVNVGES